MISYAEDYTAIITAHTEEEMRRLRCLKKLA